MNRRQFVGLALSAAGTALYADQKSVVSESPVTLNLSGWRAAFDSSGRLLSFTNGRTELVNQSLSSYSTHILYPGAALNICDSPVRSSRAPRRFLLNMNSLLPIRSGS